MSRRAKVHEVSSPISLFPFIGILLCTMGALLVILVAVSRSARDTATEQVRAQRQSGARLQNEVVEKKIAVVTQYVATLSRVRGQGQQVLNAEQRQLSNLDDHIRRLREQFKSLQLAAAELEALEEEHYDDRRQAEREVERLQQLVAESQKSIAEQRAEESNRPQSYALVPYEGPNGTFRRPIYVECGKDEVIVQPEGVSITRDDLQPPYGAGNSLAAAIRAARDHFVRLYPNEGQSRDMEPYPLLVVRPDGLEMYKRAEAAIAAADFDFGIELVESDWDLKYPAADPKLAEAAQLAVDQARVRQEVLAEAAPRVYRHPSLVASGEFEYEDDPGGGYARGPSGVYVVRHKSSVGGSGGEGGGVGTGDEFGGGNGGGGVAGDESGYGGGGGVDGSGGGVGGAGGTGDGAGVAAGGVPGGPTPSGSTAGGPGGGAPGNQPNGDMASGTAVVGGQSDSGTSAPPQDGDFAHKMHTSAEQRQGGIQSTARSSQESPGRRPGEYSAQDSRNNQGQFDPSQTREKDWALRQKPGRAVPVRRTIRVVVRSDRLAILPDDAPVDSNAPAGKVVPVQGDTVESIDSFVKQLRDHIDGWGIAGDGLYWRPVLVLSVGPDGQRRADDLTRLLKNSGLELSTGEVASNSSASDSNETH